MEVDNILNLKSRVPTKWQLQWERNMQIREQGISSKMQQQNDYRISDKLELRLIREIQQKQPGYKKLRKRAESQDMRVLNLT